MSTQPQTSQVSAERAQSLTKLIRKFKIFMMSETFTYSDKVASITFIGSNYFKLLHSYKIDDVLYKQAQEELLPAILAMHDEKSIDETFNLLLEYLEKITRALRRWI